MIDSHIKCILKTDIIICDTWDCFNKSCFSKDPDCAPLAGMSSTQAFISPVGSFTMMQLIPTALRLPG